LTIADKSLGASLKFLGYMWRFPMKLVYLCGKTKNYYEENRMYFRVGARLRNVLFVPKGGA
jgi:hypothetical protein